MIPINPNFSKEDFNLSAKLRLLLLSLLMIPLALSAQNVKQLKIATLFLKPEAYTKDIKIDYIGIEIPNKFIVGFGLDYDGLGRNIPEIYQLTD